MADILPEPPQGLADRLQRVVSVYTRAFLSQGVGLIGLVWCLFDRHPALGAGLTVLVLLDQGVFLRGRFAAENRDFPFQAALNLWCLLVSVADIVLLVAILAQAAGLRGPEGPVADPANSLAYAMAAMFHLGSDLAPVDATGRLVGALAGVLGTGLLVGALAALVRFAARRP